LSSFRLYSSYDHFGLIVAGLGETAEHSITSITSITLFFRGVVYDVGWTGLTSVDWVDSIDSIDAINAGGPHYLGGLHYLPHARRRWQGLCGMIGAVLGTGGGVDF
jgi:hypothetical protein